MLKNEERELVNIAANIKFLRDNARMTQTKLAELIGVENSTVSNYENGYSRPGTEKLELLSEIFGVSVDELIKRRLGESKFSDEGFAYESLGTEIQIHENVDDITENYPENRIGMRMDMTDVCSSSEELFDAFIMYDDSMAGANIREGDTVIIKRQDYASPEQIVLVSGEIGTILGKYAGSENGKIEIITDGEGDSERIIFDEGSIVGVAVKAIIKLR